jgi:arylsulfatase A-like enzyme
LDEVEAGSQEWDLIRTWYDGEIRYLSHLLGDLFSFLRDEGLFDETMVAVTSDHGEQFGENGTVYHQFSLSETLINVPLLVKWPGQDGPEDTDRLTSLVDLAPTAIDLAGGTPPASMDGRSLASETEHDAVFAEYAGPNESLRERFSRADGDFREYLRGYQAVRTRDRKLVRGTDGTVTLYDVTDGTETVVEDEADAESMLERLEGTLTALPTGDDGEELADHVESHLEKMGYM